MRWDHARFFRASNVIDKQQHSYSFNLTIISHLLFLWLHIFSLFEISKHKSVWFISFLCQRLCKLKFWILIEDALFLYFLFQRLLFVFAIPSFVSVFCFTLCFVKFCRWRFTSSESMSSFISLMSSLPYKSWFWLCVHLLVEYFLPQFCTKITKNMLFIR